MKHIDSFLKKLKTDRNTFLTYLFTLISFYIVIDRLVEIIFIALTGMSVSYWGPLTYTFAMFFPVFAFYFSYSSKFVTEDKVKLSFLYIYVIGLYIIAISMIIQWINKIGWILLFSVPNYSYIIENFMDLIKPAFSSIGWFIPIVTAPSIFKFCFVKVNDTKDLVDSVFDYDGIDLSDKKEGWGPYTCEMYLCKDSETGKIIKTPESRRFESSLIVGVSGSGKTSMIFEPMMARDLEKKYFFSEASKEMGYTALRTGLATLNSPYSNEYINENFNLNMITPYSYKEKLYKAYISKLTLGYYNNKYIYKNLGITYMAPDIETIEHIKEVADNFKIKYHIIDPADPNSVGINPFTFGDPIKTSIAISSVLRRMYADDTVGSPNASLDLAYMQNITTQAVENLTLLLKEMYPRLNNSDLPTLEDLLDCMTDFSKVESLVKEMKKNEELAKEYHIQINYFEKTFFKTAINRDNTMRALQASAAQLENLLRYPGVRNILCNKNNNINYDEILENGEVVLVCTRRGDLGSSVNKAFGLFFLLLMQHSVLSRPGNEKTRIPHFLYIDEFPPYFCKATSDIFTLYRKYRVGTIISAQNLSQFGEGENTLKQTLLANCSTKIVFGNNTPEDNKWWQEEFGDKREWQFGMSYNSDNNGDPKYDEKLTGIKWAYTKNFNAGKVQAVKFKGILYKTKDLKGKNVVGKAKVDFLESRYKESQKFKNFNFSKFSSGILNSETDEEKNKKEKFDLKNLSFDTNPNVPEEIDPIKSRKNSNYNFDDADAITNFKQNNNNE
ncbi:MAG: type IV secretory system conjugative DNA transfer family protein [Candidatus Scatovivens sp.]